MTDAQLNWLRYVDPEAWACATDEQYAESRRSALNAPQPEALQPEFVTRANLHDTFAKVCTALGQATGRRLREIMQRVDELEKKPSLAIQTSGDVNVDGVERATAALLRLDKTMNTPTKVLFDKDGRIVGSTREGATDETRAQIAWLEKRVAALERELTLRQAIDA